MTLRVLVVAEDRLGMTLARDLCDRIVVERAPVDFRSIWEDPDLRETQRVWYGLADSERWTTDCNWSDAKARSRRVHPLGMRGYAVEAYRTVQTAALHEPRPDVLVLCRDTDGNEEVRAQMLDGLARANVPDLPVVLAVAHQESEAWVVAGFVPAHNAEREVVATLKRDLGFDPLEEPHRLTPKGQAEVRDAKRVCRTLLPDGEYGPRGERCWIETSLAELERRGRHTGLPAYLEAIQRLILPLIAGPTR